MGKDNPQSVLEQKIIFAFKPVVDRRSYYLDAVSSIRNLLETYFLRDLTSELSAEEKEFNFHDLQSRIKICLTNLTENAAQQTHLNLVSAFSTKIAESNLPIIYSMTQENVKNCYHFTADEKYPAKLETFMRQFACGITIYRAVLDMVEIYNIIQRHRFLDMTALLHLENETTKLKAELHSAKEYTELWEEAMQLHLELEKSYGGHIDTRDKKDFETKIGAIAGLLTTAFGNCLDNFERIYKLFPDQSRVMWVWRDASWQSLLKQMVAIVYQNQYTYSSYSGTLSIYPVFIEKINGEIAEFYSIALTDMSLFKLEKLKKADETLSHCITEIRSDAARNGILLTMQSAEENSFQKPVGNSSWLTLSHFGGMGRKSVFKSFSSAGSSTQLESYGSDSEDNELEIEGGGLG